jgi:putative transposase
VAHPRRIVPGDTYLITRRCYQRTFRLRPSRETNAIFAYCLALALAKTGVELHAVCVMSNHHHLVVTDPRGVLPEFLREFHRLTAKAMNALQGQWENLWAAEPCNVVRLVTDDDVAEKVAYVAANPVAAGLVASPREWPGLLMWEEATVVTSRPPAYFRETGTCAPKLSLRIVPPPERGGQPSA